MARAHPLAVDKVVLAQVEILVVALAVEEVIILPRPMPMMGKTAHSCMVPLTIQRSSIIRCARVERGRVETSIHSAM